MAEQQPGQERTERATPKRQDDARKRGQVVRSVELSAAAVVLAGGIGLNSLGGGVGTELLSIMRNGLDMSRVQLGSDAIAGDALRDALWHSLLACAPVFSVFVAAALCAPMALGGWNFSISAMGCNFSRLSPLAGLQRMFSVRGWVELGKSSAKFLVVAIATVAVLKHQSPAIMALGSMPLQSAIGASIRLSGQALLVLGGSLAVIAAIDVPYQLWQHAHELRMTREEVREESKESDGSPEIKNRIRAAQQVIAKRRMMQDVPMADVVIMNPEHYAVALRYEAARMRAPVLVAKGVDATALRIREIAQAHQVAVVTAPPLARALFRSVDIGVEIPAALYATVAQVLTYIHQLKTARSTGTELPALPEIDPGIEQQVARRGVLS